MFTCYGVGTTAVPPCSKKVPERSLRFILTSLLCTAIVWTPWALVWGDDLSNAAHSGQAIGRQARGAWQAPTANGGVVGLGSQGTVSFSALFPGSAGGSSGDFSAMFGNNAGAINAGQQAQRSLLTDQSSTGIAYRTLRQVVGRSRPDMRSDPLWGQTDDVLDNYSAVAATFGDCQLSTKFSSTSRQVHVADYRTCDRIAPMGGSCRLLHEYVLPPPGGIVSVSGNASMQECGIDCVRVVSSGNATWDSPLSFGINVGSPERIQTVTLAFSVPAIPSPQVLFISAPGIFVSCSNSGHCAAVSDMLNSPGNVSAITEALRRGGGLAFYPSFPPFGSSGGPATVNATLEIHYAPITSPLSDVWTNSPECVALAQRASSNFCRSSVTCSGVPPLAASGCYEGTGVRICPQNMAQSPLPGYSPFCRAIDVSVDCSGVGRGQMDCWTDAQGHQQCPYNEGTNTTDCAEMEKDPHCGFIRSECVDGATDNRGECFVHEETWDCGTMKSVPVLDRMSSLDCSGPVRCMGTDCASFDSEQSQDFAKAAAALQAAQMAVSDAQCSGDGHCIVFSGDPAECKQAVGGIVDCCETPDGVSLADYMSLVMNMAKVDNALMSLDRSNAIRGAWETLRGPVSDAYSAVSKTFTSVAENVTGSTTTAATDTAAQSVVSTLTQDLLNAVAQWTADVFGDAAANTLFVSAADASAPAVSNGAVAQAGVQLAPMIASVLTVVMWVYLIYTIVMILIKIIWKCEKDEFELGAKRELKSCHRIGSYCRKKVLGWCVEKRQAFCCFNTPLARIMNEQIRPQLGRAWGSAQSPDCAGIDVADFNRVDWSQVNLDEWLAILVESGQFPTAATLNIDDLTGMGSALSDGARPNALQRTVSHTEGLNGDQLRQDAEDSAWGSTLPTLPVPAGANGVSNP